MTLRPVALCIDANDHARLARFWAGVLRRETFDDPDDGLVLLPSDQHDLRIEFQTVQEPKTGPNQMHFDLTSTSLEDQQATVKGREPAKVPELMIIADRTTPFRLLFDVIYSAKEKEAGYKRFRLIVQKHEPVHGK